jgi:hypothetical protein
VRSPFTEENGLLPGKKICIKKILREKNLKTRFFTELTHLGPLWVKKKFLSFLFIKKKFFFCQGPSPAAQPAASRLLRRGCPKKKCMA